ncbi:coatomer gamma subunit [Strigomonas culicis]|uniref:Coatomer subunit gamma n=1 Tax=Strigomonas culicis TaxID=28005 RepID=S9U9W8_9TRYP|nr:coatomer gamma subunit [Strigomonas culicis]EPY25539.1 coatomer gamma subunit [Strigomonas culicis]|eukprot:EPY21484.1 coatomer gamma subunit [Strigomonas culicis]
MNDHRSEEEEVVNPFTTDKSAALQQCRVFNSVPLNVDACTRAITQILYLLATGTRFSETDATDLFFMSTKLLQSAHPKLRRLHYILMKELSPLVSESFIASNSLMNDVKGGTDSAKSSAIRTLYCVMDSTMYNALDRTIVELMNSQNPGVVTAALVTAIHMAHTNAELPKKWWPQLMNIMNDGNKAQYLNMALLHMTRKNDRFSVNKLVDQAQRGQLRPLALCLLIRMCAEHLQEDFEGSIPLYTFVCSMMKQVDDMVVFEALKAICSLRTITDKEVMPAVLVLRSYLTQQHSVAFFVTVSLLSECATMHPAVVAPLNTELESLVLSSDRNIATLAITALLKTGTEDTIDRLVGQLTLTGQFGEFGDEFKIVIVDAMRVLNAKFPSKFEVLLAFLFKMLNTDGSCQLKQAVVDTMMDIASANPSSKDTVLTHLAEFIDDCEFADITKQVLIHLAEEVPCCSAPKKYIRYVYNHATLDKEDVRAVAISTLAKLAARLPAQRRSILVLLKRSCMDTADEVRDRACLYSTLLASGDEVLIRSLIIDVAKQVVAQRLAKYAAKQQRKGSAGRQEAFDAAALQAVATAATAEVSQGVLQGREELRKVKQLRDLGEPLRSCEAEPLTDADSEYVVTVMKHAYAEHLVLQFKIKNTMDRVAFRHVTVLTDTEELEVEPLYAVPVETISPGATAYGYVVLRYEPPCFPSGSVPGTFRFAMQEEGDDVTPEEEYPLESFDVDVKDFVTPQDLGGGFASAWEKEEANETAGTYALSSMRNLTVAVQALADFFGMHIQGGVPEKVSTTSHTLSMSGTVATEARSLVLVQAKVFVTQDSAVGLHLALRGGDAELREYLSGALLG